MDNTLIKEIIDDIAPFLYNGAIIDKNGNTIIKANRESGTTPLRPTERDQLLKHITNLLNQQETRVYTVPCLPEGEEWEQKNLKELSNDDFIRLAEDEGEVWSLTAWQDALNNDTTDTSECFVRFITTQH